MNTTKSLSPVKGDYIPEKALQELKEALFQEIGVYADNYTEAELRALGNFVLTVVGLSMKIRLRKLQEEKHAQINSSSII
ncbi:MAG TPA: hypothetical protein PKH16_00105 [Aequorivita sp.]|nr:hypothetical protein [Aequorivita sp.]